MRFKDHVRNSEKLPDKNYVRSKRVYSDSMLLTFMGEYLCTDKEKMSTKIEDFTVSAVECMVCLKVM